MRNDGAKRQQPGDAEVVASQGERVGEVTEPRKSLRLSPGWSLALGLSVLLAACSTPEEKAQAHLERGIAAQERGAHDEAIVEFRRALQDEPNRAETHYHLALSRSRRSSSDPGSGS